MEQPRNQDVIHVKEVQDTLERSGSQELVSLAERIMRDSNLSELRKAEHMHLLDAVAGKLLRYAHALDYADLGDMTEQEIEQRTALISRMEGLASALMSELNDIDSIHLSGSSAVRKILSETKMAWTGIEKR